MSKRITKTLILLLLLFIAGLPSVYAQRGNVTGIVRDAADGSTIPGASVVVKGTVTGTTTDIDGKFVLTVDANTTLVISFIGYATQEVLVQPNTSITIDLKSEIMNLDEFIVIGYGVQKKTDRTGAVASITSKDMNAGVLTDPVQGLQGKVAGVLITKKGGDPNSGFDMKIRGASSLSTNTSPLYVIDGVPGADPTTIAPEDIETFNVLKDASAAAIYGSRGANGVVIITTKRGLDRKGAQIDFNTFFSIETVANRLDLVTGNDYRNFVNKYPSTLGASFIDGGANTDWQDEIYRTGTSQNYNLAFAGGDGSSSYRASVSHQKFTGVVIGSDKTRTIGRINLDQKALDDRLTISSGLSGTVENNNYISYGGWGSNEVLYQAFQRNPTDPVKDKNGEYYEIERVFQYYNPVNLVDQIHNERDAKRFFGYLKADMKIFEGFEAGVNLAYTRNDDEGFYFEPTTMYLGTHQGYGRRNYNNYDSKVLEATLRYNNDFGKSSLQSVAGYSFQEDFYTGFRAQGRQPFVNYTMMHDLSLFQSVVPGDITSYKSSSRLISFFARGIYSYNSKYFLTATIRRDGSSKFGINNEWGWFPSASAMWNITGEDFMQNIDVINNLRLRVGYGITGNQEIGTYNDVEYYQSAGNSFNFETGEEAILFQFAHAANPDLKWEENAELNIGLDFGLFDDMISGSVDYFKKNTYDLLGQYSVPMPPYRANRIWANVGEFEVTGLEFYLQAYPVKNNKIDWRTSLVFSTYKQDVINLSSGQFQWSRLEEGWLSGPGLVGDLNWTQTVQPGMPLGTWYMPEYAGLSQDGKFLFYTATGGVTRELEQAERRNVGSAQPDFELGWSNYLTFFKNWDFNFTFRAVVGHEIFNTTRLIFGNPTFLPDRNVLYEALDEYERGLRDNPKLSSYYLEDGTFVRLDNLSLGYNFKNIAGFERIRLYFASNNVFTLTNYSGIDPEISPSGLSFGLDQYNTYPKARTFTFGLNITL
ncbi:MAG TPA: SusC/RagA family TonB-linked outer membrane protein [Bacteroidales bacterium]|nr:SusC/RagA family TonB-linked outer membrane protein [Bacteroidales bacterium]